MMKFARGGPTDKDDLKRPRKLSAYPRAGLTGASSTRCHRSSLKGCSDSVSRRLVAGLILGATFPNGPDYTGQLVGQRHNRLIVAAGFVNLQSPKLKRRRFRIASVRTPQQRAATMNEQHPKIGIAALVNPSQSPSLTTGMFPGCKSQIAGKVAAGREIVECLLQSPPGP